MERKMGSINAPQTPYPNPNPGLGYVVICFKKSYLQYNIFCMCSHVAILGCSPVAEVICYCWIPILTTHSQLQISCFCNLGWYLTMVISHCAVRCINNQCKDNIASVHMAKYMKKAEVDHNDIMKYWQIKNTQDVVVHILYTVRFC